MSAYKDGFTGVYLKASRGVLKNLRQQLQGKGAVSLIQSRRLSVLMLLGLNSKECLDVLSAGQWVLAAGSVIILGIPLSYLASRLISATMSCDMYTIPKVLDANASLVAAGLTACSALLGSAALHRKLKKYSRQNF